MSPLSSSLSTLRSLIGLQLLSRLITFSLNQSLIRLVSPRAFGTAAVQFELVRDTVLFLSREGVRGVLLRVGSVEKDREGEINNKLARQRLRHLTYLPTLFGLFSIATLIPPYLYTLPTSTTTQPHYHLALTLYLISTVFELFSDAFFLGTQSGILADPARTTPIRIRAEGLGVVARATVTVASIGTARSLGHNCGQEWALVGFGLGQIAFALVVNGVWAVLLGNQTSKGVALRIQPFMVKVLQMPRWLSKSKASQLTDQPLDPSHLHLLTALTGQSLFKHFLTEADRIVVSWTSPLEDQGGYAIAANYASLIARIVLQPLEESSRIYFAQSVPSAATGVNTDLTPFRILGNLIRLSITFLLLTLAFIPPVAPIVVPYLLPRQYISTSAPQTLVAYLTIYLPVMSMNGILEAFFSATTDVKGLAGQSGVMVACTGAFAGSLIALDRLRSYASQAAAGWLNPESSLVYANSVQMMCRIAYAGRHAGAVRRKVTSMAGGFERYRPLPKVRSMVTIAAAAGLVRLVLRTFGHARTAQQLLVIGVTVILGLGCLLVLYLDERSEWHFAPAPKPIAKTE